MTPQEAKKILFNQWQSFLEDCIDYGGISEAYKMAFKALAQESITWIVGKDNCQVAVRNMPIDKMQKICAIIGDEEQQPCEDCISREDTIEAIQDKYYDNAIGIDIVDMIAHMPAAIPEQLGEHFAEGYKKGIENEQIRT